MSECALPADDLMRLADAIAKARDNYLDAYMNDYPFTEDRRHDLERLLWDDKGTFAPALRVAAESQAYRRALEAAGDYLMNAKIDLETGAPKRTAIRTIDGGLKMIREALAPSPIGSEQS